MQNVTFNPITVLPCKEDAVVARAIFYGKPIEVHLQTGYINIVAYQEIFGGNSIPVNERLLTAVTRYAKIFSGMSSVTYYHEREEKTFSHPAIFMLYALFIDTENLLVNIEAMLSHKQNLITKTEEKYGDDTVKGYFGVKPIVIYSKTGHVDLKKYQYSHGQRGSETTMVHDDLRLVLEYLLKATNKNFDTRVVCGNGFPYCYHSPEAFMLNAFYVDPSQIFVNVSAMWNKAVVKEEPVKQTEGSIRIFKHKYCPIYFIECDSNNTVRPEDYETNPTYVTDDKKVHKRLCDCAFVIFLGNAYTFFVELGEYFTEGELREIIQ